MIRFQCPTCQKVLKAPDNGVGQKVSCPGCGQRLQVPPHIQPLNQTVLGQPMPDDPATPPVLTGGKAPDRLADVEAEAAPRRRRAAAPAAGRRRQGEARPAATPGARRPLSDDADREEVPLLRHPLNGGMSVGESQLPSRKVNSPEQRGHFCA
jgi:hypothetical protein